MDGTTYQSGAASLFEEARQFVERRQAISMIELQEGLAIDRLQASQLLFQLEQAGVISANWKFSLGGYEVLTFKGSHWVGGER